MLAGARRQDRQFGMRLVRRGDIDHLDLGVGAERLGRLVRAAAELRREGRPGLGPRVGGGHHAAARIGPQGWAREIEPPAEADHADSNDAAGHLVETPSWRSPVNERVWTVADRFRKLLRTLSFGNALRSGADGGNRP